MSSYDSTGWFIGSEIYTLLQTTIDPYGPHRILEIGCFEGVGSSYFSDVFLDHPEASLTCVDPFLPGDPTTPQVTNATRERFYANIDASDNRNKIRVCECTSDEFFRDNTEQFSIIYIDGDHRYEGVKRDLHNAAKVLQIGGILWCDDYIWLQDDIQRAVDEFLEEKGGEFTVFHKGRQIALQRQKH
jgi:predicted O-methyltransferase YrrM